MEITAAHASQDHPEDVGGGVHQSPQPAPRHTRSHEVLLSFYFLIIIPDNDICNDLKAEKTVSKLDVKTRKSL